MYITYLLLVVTFLVSVRAFNDNELRYKFLFNPYLITHEKQWYRSFSHAFIHAHWPHLIFNMFVLYSFGISLEQKLINTYDAKGYLYFGSLYLGGILFSNLYSLAKHKDNPGYNSLGASGAVMAVMFAFIMANPSAKLAMLFLPIPISAVIMGPLILAAEYFMAKRGGTGIAHDAHIGGAIFGIIYMIALDLDFLTNFFRELSNLF